MTPDHMTTTCNARSVSCDQLHMTSTPLHITTRHQYVSHRNSNRCDPLGVSV